MKHIVKRQGHKEMFDARKIYASCYFSCLNVHLEKKEAEKICEKVSKDVKKWVKGKEIVNSNDIFKAVIRFLKKYNEDAAFMYETHRDVS